MSSFVYLGKNVTSVNFVISGISFFSENGQPWVFFYAHRGRSIFPSHSILLFKITFLIYGDKIQQADREFSKRTQYQQKQKVTLGVHFPPVIQKERKMMKDVYRELNDLTTSTTLFYVLSTYVKVFYVRFYRFYIYF